MSAHGGLWYVKILRLGNLFKNQGIWMQMLVSLQKLSWGMEFITTVMTDPSCQRGCILSRIYKKQLKGETAESWSLSVYVYHLSYGSNKPNLPSMEPSFPS